MLLPRRIKLLLTTTLAASSLTLVIAAYWSSEARTDSSAVRPTLKSKILRRKDRLKEKPNAYELALIRAHATVQEERQPEKRQLDDKIPKHVPIKVKVRSEKEKAFRDLNNEKWLRNLELEITNVSDRPIYFLEIWADLPEIISENGRKIGFSLRYGRIDFIDFDTRPLPGDDPIRPGQTYTFTIAENYQRAWESHRAKEGRSNPKRVELKFVQLNFGDGTGFNGTDAMPYPYKREQSSAGPCVDGQPQRRDKLFTNRRQTPLPDWSEHSLLAIPALIMPVNFFLIEAPNRTSEMATPPDICCPGTDCEFGKPGIYQCVCNSYARTVYSAACSDSQGRCSIDEFHDT